MSRHSMSDIIEAFLKQSLKGANKIEIKRSDIADQFDCVPSQINYVINTRFTQAHGYQVESKRGGGGYIRIFKIELVDEVDQIDQMLSLFDHRLSQRRALVILETLLKQDAITQREAQTMGTLIHKDVLTAIGPDEQRARAIVMQNFLEQLRYTYNE